MGSQKRTVNRRPGTMVQVKFPLLLDELQDHPDVGDPDRQASTGPAFFPKAFFGRERRLDLERDH